MAQSGDTGVTMYAGLAIVLLIALAALALFKFNLFNVGNMLGNTDDGGRASIGRGNSGDDGTDGGTRPDSADWTNEIPDAAKYYTSHQTPLPETLTVQKVVNGETFDIEMCLVPQGWFAMGENDGVNSNMPKRWIWLDDYYIAKTEMTNTQFYGFILADGYRKSEFWTQEGHKYITDGKQIRGTRYIGWLPLEASSHIWALASPQSNREEVVTLEVLEEDGILGLSDCTVLVLPGGGTWGDFLSFDRVAGHMSVRMKFREEWKDVTGADIRNNSDRDLKRAGYLHFTDKHGRIDLTDVRSRSAYRILAWANGDKAPPLLARLKRSDSPAMRNGNIPVVELSWFEADACARFFGGTLPTEAQWEKAGRGATGKLFPWGADLQMDYLKADSSDTKRFTTPHANLNRWDVMPVGSFETGISEYGVHDLVGNVTEWCRDVYLEKPEWDEKNPMGRGSSADGGYRRSERGSSTHDDDPQTAKLHNRRYSDPYKRSVDTRGFRIVLDPKTALEMAKK